jgi:4-diphosphocytidyl-2-C-methyl-D-erythritol kinase
VSGDLTVSAFAKINLTLDVLGLRGDGYHEISSVMTTLQLHDSVRVSVREGDGIFVAAGLRHVPSDMRNTAAKAADAFLRRTNQRLRIELSLRKRIPVGAGLAGGSADAAATLIALNALTRAKLPRDELADIGAEVGSDVPFCVLGGTRLARGRGEVLSALPSVPNCRVVVVKPAFSVSTPVLFQAIDSVEAPRRPDENAVLDALRCGDLRAVADALGNVFEDALTEPTRHEIDAIKTRLTSLGALAASMTGTGSAVFALFDDELSSRRAADTMRRRYRETFLTRVRSDV